jgi:hypothetical protein
MDLDGVFCMKRTKLKSIVIAIVVCLGLSTWLVPPTAALGWNVWTSSAVGDVSEGTLPFYWDISSTPKSGYASYLWSDWHTVIDSNLDLYDDVNDNHEIRFSTYSSSNLMGVITLESESKITDTEVLYFKGRYGARFSYHQVRTLGYVRLFDVTTQTIHKSIPIYSGTSTNNWKWETFSKKYTDLNKDHEYVIQLVGNDAWISQKVEVAFESADVWFHAPYWDRAVHLDSHSWRHLGRMHYYLCEWLSDFYFKQTPIYDMVRDHRPYVVEPSWPVPVGDPYGWDPCYLHEFRSVPFNALEYDNWYMTDLPGSIGDSESTELEEIFDGYEEVEIYTLNPELLQANIVCYVKIRYQVWLTGDVTVTTEAELGNEDDYQSSTSPPAYPVAYVEPLKQVTVSHSQKSYVIYYPMTTASSGSDNDTLIPIDFQMHHEYYDVFIKGMYPSYLKVYTRLNVRSMEDLIAFQQSKSDEVQNYKLSAAAGQKIPSTITFNDLVSFQDVLNLIEKYDMDAIRYRFTAQDEFGKIVRGQGAPSDNDRLSLSELTDFINGFELLGIQSLDMFVDSNKLNQLLDDEMISIIDLSAFLTTLDFGIDINTFDEVFWFTEDASWYLNSAFNG